MHTAAVNQVDAAEPTTPGKAPAFQLYANDFISDANVVLMSLQERGAYITLICFCWQQGSLPNNVELLARYCGSPVGAFRKLWPALAPCFRADPTSTDRLVHPRLERERQKHAHNRELKSSASRKRWDKQQQSSRNAPASPVDMQNRSSSVFSLHTSVKKACEGDPADEIASGFLEEYPSLYARVRSGARYAVSRLNMERDLDYARDLARGWPDLPRLLRMAEVFLRMEIGDKNRPGTIGQFLHMAPDADQQLRKNGL